MISNHSDYVRSGGFYSRDAVVQTNATVSIETLSQQKCVEKDCSMNSFTRCSLICPEMQAMAMT